MDVDSKWWLPHLALALALPALALFILIFGIVEVVVGPINVGSAGGAVTYVALGLYLALFLIALYGYDADSKYLRNAGSDWVPRPWLWAILHIFLTPIVTAPLYLLRRWQKFGLSLSSRRGSTAAE